MLLEWVLSLATPAPLRHRRLGYVRESVLLYSRSRRCRAAWAPHLAAARAVVAQSLADLIRRDLAVVLGSGLLDDVPLALLSRTFARVRLVDAVHPWPARLIARRHPNVELVTLDLSGADALADGPGITSDAIGPVCAGADLVVSANLLSQLPILPVDRFEGRGLQPPHRLGARIVEAHLAALDRLDGRVCLITDTHQREEDRDGTLIDSLDLLHGVRLPPGARGWDWELAPFGEAARHHRTLHRVQAYPDWSAARHGERQGS